MQYADIADLAEDARIKLIVDYLVSNPGVRAMVAVDYEDVLPNQSIRPGSKPGDKLDRYLKKIKAKLPGVVVKHRGPGPVKNTEHAIVVHADPTSN